MEPRVTEHKGQSHSIRKETEVPGSLHSSLDMDMQVVPVRIRGNPCMYLPWRAGMIFSALLVLPHIIKVLGWVQWLIPVIPAL